MPTLSLVNFNIVCAVLGGFISIFGLVSYLLKEKFYLSEALISTLWGVIFGPHAANFIRPLEYADSNEIDLETITLYFTRLVLGVQLVLAGVQLPSKYLWKEMKSLSILLGPGMCIMWISTSLLVWAMVPRIDFVMAIAVGACVTPTDPILSNGIVKGKFADKNIPPPLQKIIIAESGANDGLGYPFLFLGLYLLRYAGNGGLGQHGGVGHAMALWFYDTWAYVIVMSVVYGAVVGWMAKELLHWAEDRHYVDRESFLVFAIALALFIVGTVGLIGSDDVLACFIAGNAFTWDDWFRLETMDDSLQPTIDMLLNVAIFLWFGAVCPWHQFVDNSVIPIYRLVPLGILVLLLRRLPMLFAFHKAIHQVEHWKHASFVGFFGPIGVSAIFYLYVAREFLREIEYEGEQRADAAQLSEVLNVVVWFLVACSILAHGLSIPLGKFGFYLPRTISTAITSERVSRSPSQNRSRHSSDRPDIDRRFDQREPSLVGFFHRRSLTKGEQGPAGITGAGDGGLLNASLTPFRRLYAKLNRSGQPVTPVGNEKDGDSGTTSGVLRQGSRPEISAPTEGRIIGRPIKARAPESDLVHASGGPGTAESQGSKTPTLPEHWEDQDRTDASSSTPSPTSLPGWNRMIRFPDESTARSQSADKEAGNYRSVAL